VLHLGLLAHNRGTRPVQLRMHDSASYLTRPDAPFTALAAVQPDPAGTVFAAETTPPDRAAFEAVIARGTLAGPRDATPTAYDPASPPTGGSFRYGRVAGVSAGDTWHGTLFEGPDAPAPPAPGGRVGFPISTVVLNHVGTGQIQSASLLRRYADTAYQSQGNYGVTYALTVPLDNREDSAQRYTLALSSPLKVEAGAAASAVYAPPAGRRVTFRGPVKLAWRDASGSPQARYAHLVLHDGEDPPPFETLTVPAHTRLEVTLTLMYPADCTPPQLLTVGRL